MGQIIYVEEGGAILKTYPYIRNTISLLVAYNLIQEVTVYPQKHVSYLWYSDHNFCSYAQLFVGYIYFR